MIRYRDWLPSHCSRPWYPGQAKVVFMTEH